MPRGKIYDLSKLDYNSCKDLRQVDSMLTAIGLRKNAVKERTQFLYDIMGVQSVYLSPIENESDEDYLKTKYTMAAELLVSKSYLS